MDISWRPKLADRIFRPRRIKHYRLRRILGVPALFSAGYGDVGSSIYYALGIVALVALGATPIALAIAGIIYIFNALTYAEGSAMLPEAGSSASFAVAHAAILSLRAKQPDLPRPFKLRGNIRVKGREMPITAILGLISTSAVWVVLTAGQPFARVTGLVWMVGGLVIYYTYRRKENLPLTHAGKTKNI